MISRRSFLGTATVLASADRVLSQGPVAPELVVLSFAVADSRGRLILGLKPGDFRIFEDGIAQRIHLFAEGTRSPVLLNEDGSWPGAEPGRHAADLAAFAAARQTPYPYTVAYYADPSNQNEGFRLFSVDIVPDLARRWRVRHRPGYRPRRGF